MATEINIRFINRHRRSMRRIIKMGLLCILLTSACKSPHSNSYKKGRGDAGIFIATTVFEIGGSRPASVTKAIPTITTSWRYIDGKTESGSDFVQIIMPRSAFFELQDWLLVVFGEPAHKVVWSSRGTGYGAYDSQQIGARIQFYINNEKTVCQIFRISKDQSDYTQ